MTNCNYCGKYFLEKDKVGSYFRRTNSNNYNYLEFCCTGHLILFDENTEMIQVNHNGYTQREQIEQDKIKDKNSLIEEHYWLLIRNQEIQSLKEQRKSKYGSEENYFDEITKKINKDKGSCFIATAVYIDYNHPKVIDLRKFRDNYLIKFYFGRIFIEKYYRIGPFAAKLINKNIIFKLLIKYLIVVPSHFFVKLYLNININNIKHHEK